MSTISHSEQLQLKLGLARPWLHAEGHAFWTHPRIEEIFPRYLFMLYSSMRASVPLMQTAEARCREIAESDPVAAQLASYLAEHVREEMHHDEWLLDDMEALGMNRSEIVRRLPAPEVAALLGAQYYWVHHVHPVAVLGWLAAIEGDPIPVARLDQLQERTNIPKDALRTLYKHSELDIEHSEELFAEIDRLPLEREHSALLGLSALHVVEQCICIIRKVVASAEHQRAA